MKLRLWTCFKNKLKDYRHKQKTYIEWDYRPPNIYISIYVKECFRKLT